MTVIERLRELHGAVTHGTWDYNPKDLEPELCAYDASTKAYLGTIALPPSRPNPADDELVIVMRNHLPAILDALAALEDLACIVTPEEMRGRLDDDHKAKLRAARAAVVALQVQPMEPGTLARAPD